MLTDKDITRDSVTNAPSSLKTSTGYLLINETGQIGGERNTGSSVNNYDATKHECSSVVLNTQITAQAVSAGAPAFLMGIQVHTALAGTLTIAGLTNNAGVATSIVFPLGSVGSLLPPGNARRCETALTATLSNILDYDRVVIDWRPI